MAKASKEIMQALGRKLGPLPAWAWASIGGLGLFAGSKVLAAGTGAAPPAPQTGPALLSGPLPIAPTAGGGSGGGITALRQQGRAYQEALQASDLVQGTPGQLAGAGTGGSSGAQSLDAESAAAAERRLVTTELAQLRNLSSAWFEAAGSPATQDELQQRAEHIRSELAAIGVPPQAIPGFDQPYTSRVLLAARSGQQQAPAQPPARPVPQTAGPMEPAAPRRYTVRRGDTLSAIGRRFGIGWQQIYHANAGQIANPDLIYPGQALVIPNG